MRAVLGVPEFRGEPVVAAGEVCCCETMSDGGFVVVGGGAVEVAVVRSQ